MSLSKEEIIKGLQATRQYEEDREYDIEILEDNKLKTGCNACGRCCRDREDILLRPIDIYNLSKELNISEVELVTKYCDVYIGHTSHLPVISIKFRGNLFDSSTVCPFLKKAGENIYHCRVHNRKPGVCRIYPLGRISDNEGVTTYFKQNTTCVEEKDQRVYTFEEWLGEDYKFQEEFLKAFHELTQHLFDKINMKKVWDVAEKRGETKIIMSTLLSVLYVPRNNVSISESLEQYKTRTEYIDDFCAELKRKGYNVSKK